MLYIIIQKKQLINFFLFLFRLRYIAYGLSYIRERQIQQGWGDLHAKSKVSEHPSSMEQFGLLFLKLQLGHMLTFLGRKKQSSENT